MLPRLTKYISPSSSRFMTIRMNQTKKTAFKWDLQKKYPQLNLNQIPESDLNNLECNETRKTFEALILRGITLEKALAAVRGLHIAPTKPFNNINAQILNAIAQGYEREAIFDLLGGSIEEIENNAYLRDLFIEKLNFILETGDAALFTELKDMAPFTKLHQDAMKELVLRKNYSYASAAKIIQEYAIEDLQAFITQKYRDAVKKELKLESQLPIGNWFNSDDYVQALIKLVKIHGFKPGLALSTLKSIKNSKELKCIAMGLTPAQAQLLSNIQKDCLIDHQLTWQQAIAIHDNADASNTIGVLTKFHIHVDDAIKINNLMDKSSHANLSPLIHLFAPRFNNINDFLQKNTEFKYQETDIYHPGVLISALTQPNDIAAYNFSPSKNPYAVAQLLFHVMGLGQDYFENLNHKKPMHFLNREFILTVELAKEKLRRQFPKIAEYADKVKDEALYLTFNNKNLHDDIEKRFGKAIPIPSGLVNEPEQERRMSLGT